MACWLCKGLGAVAIHKEASVTYDQVLWVAHNANSKSHPVNACPACSKLPMTVFKKELSNEQHTEG